MWFADLGDPWVLLGPGGSKSAWPADGGDLGSLARGEWAGSGGSPSTGRRKPRGDTRCWTCVGAGLLLALVRGAREVPCLITPHLAPALAALCSRWRPRGQPGAPLGPRSPLGKPPDFWGQPGSYAWRAGCGRGSGAENSAALGCRKASEATCQRVRVPWLAGLPGPGQSARPRPRPGLGQRSTCAGENRGVRRGVERPRVCCTKCCRLVSEVEDWLKIP